jgi:hypothetical protein
MALFSSRPIRPDELLLDAARGITRWAVAHGLLPDSHLASSQRPYELKPPGPTLSEETIEAKYGRRDDQPDDESFVSILHSILTFGDFGRYVIESGVRDFSRYRIGKDYPKREPREPRLIKRRWQKFLDSLNDKQKNELADWLSDPQSARMSRLDFIFRRHDEDPLTKAQWELLDAAFEQPKRVDNEYPADRARRWVFQRTLSLGWTPKLFGSKDHFITQRDGRDGHKSERWGKKYQWMAYHELFARIADNYQPHNSYGDFETFEGLHQTIGDREIDPSLPPIDYQTFIENGGVDATAWDQPLIRVETWPRRHLDFGKYRGEIGRFLADIESEPTVAGSLFVRDRSGEEWVVLKSFVRQTDPQAVKSWRGLDERSAIDTVLVAAGSADRLVRALPREQHNDAQMLLESQGHIDCCYVGEIGRAGPNCTARHDGLLAIAVGDETFQIGPTVEQYRWEGAILDCSIGDSATTILPSTLIQRTAGLWFDMGGPGWLDDAGNPVFTFYEEPENDSYALLVRRTFLQDFLAEQKLELIVRHWFQRMRLSSDIEERHALIESTTDAWLAADLTIREGVPRRNEHNLRD